MEGARRAERLAVQIAKSFLVADRDASGALDREEVATVLDQLYRGVDLQKRKPEVIQKEVDQVFACYDKNGNGVLEFDEFMALILTGGVYNVSPEEIDRIAHNLAPEALENMTHGNPHERHAWSWAVGSSDGGILWRRCQGCGEPDALGD